MRSSTYIPKEMLTDATVQFIYAICNAVGYLSTCYKTAVNKIRKGKEQHKNVDIKFTMQIQFRKIEKTLHCHFPFQTGRMQNYSPDHVQNILERERTRIAK